MKRTFAALAALLLAFVFAAPGFKAIRAEEAVPVPAGYDEHDYLLVRAFLETADEQGVKNGEKMNAYYDPDDPSTWHYSIYGFTASFAHWSGEIPQRLTKVYCQHLPCVGALSLAGCTSLKQVFAEDTLVTSLDVSGCTALTTVSCRDSLICDVSIEGCEALKSLDLSNNRVEQIALSGFASLSYAFLNDNRIPEISIENCPNLRDLRLANNLLTELDVTSLGWLLDLNVNGNYLTELDLSKNSRLHTIAACGNAFTVLDFGGTNMNVREVRAEGAGTVGYERYFYEDVSETPSTVYVHAVPGEGMRFAGWFNEEGELISEEADFGGFCWAGLIGEDGEYAYYPDPLTLSGETMFTARFEPDEPQSIPGDVDGDGVVGFSDAAALYWFIIGGDPRLVANCDFNGDGEISFEDVSALYLSLIGR